MQLKQHQFFTPSLQNQQKPQQSTHLQHSEQYNYQYYEEYKRLYQTAFILSLQLNQIAELKQEISTKLLKIERKAADFKDDIRGDKQDKKKRFRRTAEEIQRPFVCEVEKCQRTYGSEGSLQQHIKLKHPQLYVGRQNQRSFQNQSNYESN